VAVPEVPEVPEREHAAGEDHLDSGAPDGLWEHVRRLPSKQRTALGLRFIADSGYDEIAAVMGTSQEAARRSVHEALKRLRSEIER
jgi:RNA polymerase sigma factor (sigma-70 family)